MALTRVRTKLDGVWTTLTYNSATGRYEGTITPTKTSINQPGGYYNIEVEATNSGGSVATLSGTALSALRLVVREAVSPTLTLVSPQPGYVTAKRPVIVMNAVDEENGSGVNASSFTVTVDGVRQTAGLSTLAISGGYRLTWTPPADLSQGPHTITFSISDRDGNPASASAAYTVDTIPPTLSITLPDNHRVVDDSSIVVAGAVYDATSPPCTVRITANSVDLGASTAEGGTFSRPVPLEVGINTIVITALDGAGLSTSQTITVIRLVTDRTAADVEKVRDLCLRGYAKWTNTERSWWASARCLRGSYDYRDLNRVTAAMEHINAWLEEYGYISSYRPENRVWTEEDAMTISPARRYLQNVEALRAALPLPENVPETPKSMAGIRHPEANDIEAILVAVDAMRPLLDKSAWFAGEIYCGEV